MDRDDVVSVKAYELILRENMELREKIRQLKKLKGVIWNEKDGERLDWLEKAQPNQWDEVTNNFDTWDLRQAIDAAMNDVKTKPPTDKPTL